ncbi:hypothetical protein HPB50_023202 [Hyalomma asiaticum]|uniref:Uncharacterized protein n=1 Tax=Hyalomma asiaticum TaxID=266040 RepID=A0ACB7TMD5_HYAAI|nr:hypothetical protein HPB50_023202 [Hyalomma asiaticum]
MDDIDEYARKLAERTRARGRNLHHKKAEPTPPKRSLTADDLSDQCGGDTEKKASPPKRQCLGDDKENADTLSVRVGRLQSLKESSSTLASKSTEDAEWVALPRHALVGDDTETPRGLAALRRKHVTSPNFGSKESRQVLSQAAALDEENKRAPRGLAALRRRQEDLFEADVVPSSTCQPKSPLAKIEKPKQPASRNEIEGNSLQSKPQKNNNWDPKVIASLEAQGFMKSPSASKLSYSFKPHGCHDPPDNSDCLIEVKTHEGSCTVSPPLPPPLPSAKTAVSTTNTGVKVNKPNVTVTQQKPANNFSQGGLPQRPQAQHMGRDPSELSLQQRKALFEATVVAEQAQQPCEAPENLSVAQRKALFEQQMKLSKAAAERSYPVGGRGGDVVTPVLTVCFAFALTVGFPVHITCDRFHGHLFCREDTRISTSSGTAPPLRRCAPECALFNVIQWGQSITFFVCLRLSCFCCGYSSPALQKQLAAICFSVDLEDADSISSA